MKLITYLWNIINYNIKICDLKYWHFNARGNNKKIITLNIDNLSEAVVMQENQSNFKK